MSRMKTSRADVNAESYEHHLSEYLDSRSKRLVFFQINARVLFSLLVVTEFSLALAGFDPGRTIYDNGFSPVDELVDFKGYEADDRGIMHLDRDAKNFANDYIKENDLGNELLFMTSLNLKRKHYTPYRVGRDFLEVIQGKVRTEFSVFIDKLKSNSGTSPDETAILTYLKSPINSDGFRSIEFENISSDKRKVFLLGDSFTWGAGVENLSSSFADNLTSQGFLVYNSGIVGTDLPQYKEVASKYLAKVKPDVVILNLFVGNDIAEHRIDLKPFHKQFFNTNAGTLMAAPHGEYVKNADEAYEKIIDQAMIPKNMSFVNFISSQTRISTLLWRLCAKMGVIGHVASKESSDYWDFVNKSKLGYSVNAEILKEIEQICEANQCELIVSIIPERDNLAIDKYELDKMVVNFPYVRISNLTKEDYSPDYHLNESGCRKYAAFLQEQIQE